MERLYENKKIIVTKRIPLTVDKFMLYFCAFWIFFIWAIFISGKNHGILEFFLSLIGTIVMFLLFLAVKKMSFSPQPLSFMEIYDDGWIRVKDRGSIYPDYPIENIIEVWYSKKYKKKFGTYYIALEPVFVYDGKVYIGVGPSGLLIKPQHIKEIDKFVNELEKKAKINKEREDMDHPPRGFWNEDKDWLNNPEAIKIKLERDKMREKAGIPPDYPEKTEE